MNSTNKLSSRKVDDCHGMDRYRYSQSNQLTTWRRHVLLIFSILAAIHIMATILFAGNSRLFVMCSIRMDMRYDYPLYENITPMVISKYTNVTSISDDEQQELRPTLIPLNSSIPCTSTLVIQIDAFRSTFVINLEKNKRLISDRFFQVSHSSQGFKPIDRRKQSRVHAIKGHNKLSATKYNDDHCHYHGVVNNQTASLSAISIIGSALSGFFYDGHEMYFLSNIKDNTQTVIFKSLDNTSITTSGDTSNLASEPSVFESSHDKMHRSKRSSSTVAEETIKYEPFGSNSSSLFVELLIVHDHNIYKDYKKNNTLIAERTMQIVNIMNAFYKQLNIFISLVGVILWTEKDEIEVTTDGDETLTNFLKYRYEKLLPKYHHDNAQLITNKSFNGSVVGKALKGPICTYEHSGGVNTDHSHNSAVVAATLAHELGHNFGMQHDEDGKCSCPEDKCIMSASSSPENPKFWSSCSIDYLEDSRKHGYLDCLKSKPLHLFGPVCGNGFVEEGEDCDPGVSILSFSGRSKKNTYNKNCTNGQQNCDINRCCDKLTCKFTANSTCSDGPCCDRSSCSIIKSTISKICRARQTECDLEETCDGVSEFCPEDAHYHDGIECTSTLNSDDHKLNINRTRAYCYQGKCASHESQCQLLWGPTGQVSKDICFNQNIQGNTSGNCGYDRIHKIYKPCDDGDKLCGMLHCMHHQEGLDKDKKGTGKLEYGFEQAALLSRSYFTLSSRPNIDCRGAIIDAGPGIRDPGLVPDGAACGDQKMCMNQRCVPLSDVFSQDWCPSNCNGNGICDNRGICHCDDGTKGTSCFRLFGAGFHLSVALYIILFFVPLVALIIYVINHYQEQIKTWWFLQNRKKVLKNRAKKETNQNRRNLKLPPDTNRNNISISDPLPLENKTPPVYDPTVDPWADTSGGYKLEDIRRQDGRIITSSDMRPVRAAPLPPSQTRPDIIPNMNSRSSDQNPL